MLVIMGYMTDWQFVKIISPDPLSDDRRQIVYKGLIESSALWVSHLKGWNFKVTELTYKHWSFDENLCRLGITGMQQVAGGTQERIHKVGRKFVLLRNLSRIIHTYRSSKWYWKSIIIFISCDSRYVPSLTDASWSNVNFFFLFYWE